jgi:DNA-binding NarL/FixJ family response regulator
MRIGIVNDVTLAVESLRRALVSRPEHRVVWVARDGAEAVQQCARETPDVVLMDLIMPVMDGVEATRRIMAKTPCAILVTTVDVKVNSGKVFAAMGYGALDAVNTSNSFISNALSVGRMYGSSSTTSSVQRSTPIGATPSRLYRLRPRHARPRMLLSELYSSLIKNVHLRERSCAPERFPRWASRRRCRGRPLESVSLLTVWLVFLFSVAILSAAMLRRSYFLPWFPALGCNYFECGDASPL